MIKAILACDEEWGIGKRGDLPWPHNPADLKWFKDNTVNGIVVMGKSTWDSLPRKPLPKRKNIVVTRTKLDSAINDYEFIDFSNIKFKLLNMNSSQNIWVIGGAKLIEGLFGIIDEFHLSRIKGIYNCDTFLPGKLIKEQYFLSKSNMVDGVNFDIWCKK